MKLHFLFSILSISPFYSSSAQAKRNSSNCDKLKPRQTITEEKTASLSLAFKATLSGGQGGASGSKKQTSVILEDQALAQAYFTYQACLLRETGMIDQKTAQEIVRYVMGLDNHAPANNTSSTQAVAPPPPPPVIPPPVTPPPSTNSRITASEAVAQILALPNGGSSSWDYGVQSVMLQAFDADKSGKLDTSSEVSNVSCDVWSALDQGLRAGGEYTSSILAIYGFDPTYSWIGYAVGFSESYRSETYAKANSCLGYKASSASSSSSGSLSASQAATQILALPNGGSSAWDDRVESLLLQAFDANKSGQIDTSSEVSNVSCDVWSALDQGLRAGGEYTSSILAIYGFDPTYGWVGSAVGFSESYRSELFAKADSCLGYSGSSGASSSSNSGPLSASQAATQILALPNGGSSAWDNSVESLLLRAFDTNKSGEIDTSSEVSSVTCEVWSALDNGMRAGGEYSSSILAVYGFAPSFGWVGYAVGFSESYRNELFSKAAGCLNYSTGSTTTQSVSTSYSGGSLTASTVAAQILALPGGGSGAWDDSVKSLMLQAFDSNNSGEIDTSSELSSVTCDVWSALDNGMRAGGEYSSSILAVYGFDPSLMWVGYAVGFSESYRTEAFNAAKSCIGY